jgi:hypothetical protein
MFLRRILFLTVLFGGLAHAEQAPIETNKTETIIIRDPIPPVWPKLKTPNVTNPPYSEEAIERNAWTRAWMVLDLDRTGRVTAVKFLKRPGYDLESIAIAEAFKLQFEPARNVAGDPVRVRYVWFFEWPAYWFLVHKIGYSHLRPPHSVVKHVPCAGSGPWRMNSFYKGYRDCSKPDLSKAESEKWIYPPVTRRE